MVLLFFLALSCPGWLGIVGVINECIILGAAALKAFLGHQIQNFSVPP